MQLNIDPEDHASALDYWEALAVELVRKAEEANVIITVERRSVQPLEMRNHVAHVEVREKR